jgi:hypothetical protein
VFGWTKSRGARVTATVAVVGFVVLLLTPVASTGAPTATIYTVAVVGDPTSPTITLTGSGFGTEPADTNLALAGYTGYDYGNALYVCDTSSDPNTFCAGQNNGTGGDTIGLIVNTYSDTEIQLGLGSSYAQYYYPHNIFRLESADHFAIYVAGATCSGVITYGGAPVQCSSPPAPPPPPPPMPPQPTPTPPPLLPVDETPPTISGTTIQGNVLTEAHGTWTESPTAFTYQWEDCDPKGVSCAAITGATGATYTLGASDSGHTIAVAETAANAGGSGTPAQSTATNVVLPALRANPRAHKRILTAASVLLHHPSAHVAMTVTLTGTAAAAAGVADGTSLSGAGVVDFPERRASWTLALPATLGGGSLSVITTPSVTYLQLGKQGALGSSRWIRVDPAQLASVPHLGFIGTLAVLLNPWISVKLLASTSPTVAQAQPGAPRAQATAGEPSPSAVTAAASCSVTPGVTSIQTAIDPKHLVDLGKLYKKTVQEGTASWHSARMVAQLGSTGRLAGIQLMNEEGLTILDDFCPSDQPTGIAALPSGAGQLTDVKAWLTIDPCLVGTWLLSGPLENYPNNPIATGTTQLVITPAGTGTLTYNEIKIPLPLSAGSVETEPGGFVGNAIFTIAAPVATSDIVHKLVWAVVSDDIVETSEGYVIPGTAGYYLDNAFGPPIYVPGIPDDVVPALSFAVGPNGHPTSDYDCNGDLGTLNVTLPFGNTSGTTDPAPPVLFLRSTPAYKP